MDILELISEQVLVFDDGETVLVLSEGDIEIVDVAEQGPPGIPGIPGISGNNIYEHTQSAPDEEWIVNHNLGYRPAIEIFDTGGSEVDAHVLHLSLNQARIYLNIPAAGSARCN